ncbi:DUF2306 domain-containing protein [Sphingomonas suaedae]|uniref:DUF2306 domain-containing protein n=2 Tax=Sphingomonas suaedae TaxID=2599297 RepID=A0A518RHC0_9SPHN|nr:DUF2306 domain-containing protein [Sphingomonas suaedae]
MPHSTAPISPRRATSNGLNLPPVLRVIVGVAGFAMTLAMVVALARLGLGLAPTRATVREVAVLVHIVTVLPAVPLGMYLMLRRKGDARHKMLGKVWVALMVVTAISAIFIRHINDGGFSFIHLFVPLTLIGAWRIFQTARRGQIARHRNHLIGMYLGALMIPGIFAFTGERLMAMWLFW